MKVQEKSHLEVVCEKRDPRLEYHRKPEMKPAWTGRPVLHSEIVIEEKILMQRCKNKIEGCGFFIQILSGFWLKIEKRDLHVM
jgi:hypothetical protein